MAKDIVNSFGNNRRSYLYSAKWSDMKYNLAIEIINKHDVFSGYKQTDTYKNAKRPYDEGKLEKSVRGVYILPEVWGDEFVDLQARFKKGIFSNETALFLWDLTDRTPNRYDMCFPNNYNLTNVRNEGVNCARVKQEWYDEGKTQIQSPGGNKIMVYSMERTLCDILRKRGGLDKGIVAEAFKRYVIRTDKNIPLLSEYAKKFHVEDKVRTYLEVLM